MNLNSIISLGSHCEPGIHYRRFFGAEPYSPFDWLITYPLETLLKILDTDGKYFGDEVAFAMDGTSAICTKYGCFYHHEFERNEKGMVLISSQALKICKEKLNYKYLKFINIARNTNPLFIRWSHGAEYPSKSDKFIYTIDEVSSIYKTIEDKLGHQNFHIAFVGVKNINNFELIDPECLTIRPNISCFQYDMLDQSDVDFFWDNFFTRFGFEKNSPPAIGEFEK